MAHVAMVSIPYPGHVHPSLELVRGLVARGHRVTYVSDPTHPHGPRLCAAIEATGAELRPYSSTLDAWEGDVVDHLTRFQAEYEAMLPQVRAHYEHDRPDLFLYDIAGITARILADKWGVPALQLSPAYVGWDGYEDDLADFLSGIEADPRGRALRERERTWFAAQGVTTDPLSYLGRPDRSVVLISPLMQPHLDRVDREVHTFVGPLVRPVVPSGAWTPPGDDVQVLLVSLGSAFTDRPDFYRRCVQAYGDRPGWHVVLQIGSTVDPADLGPLPATVETHPWVPQLEVLGRADAFLTHAGMGGSSEGLVTGTPMIAAPQDADQFENADRLVAAGVAVRIDSEAVTVEELRTALDAISAPAVRTRSRSLADDMHRAGGLDAAVAVVESRL
ncbi:MULTISPECIES: macrolide family glycosyltransferase [unclassified Nocardioides]|uniref:macrolide family glycosyltransferase n=1 Tax=unclassified Nocardioides TaxID=2615069 RepID=UPI0030150ED7